MKNFFPKNNFRFILPILLLIVSACREDDPDPLSDQQAKVNSWILENMKFWYLWNDRLPANPDMSPDPETFFHSLLVNEDRFSWIEEDYQTLTNSLQGINHEAGYEFALYKESEAGNNVNAQIVYVKPSSPAFAAGLKRGDLITGINGEQLTVSNYQSLLQEIREDHSLHYKPLLTDQEKFGDETTVALSAVEYRENPNYLSKVIETGGHRIGYYVYNFFSTGTDGNPDKYEKGMEQIFENFKANGVTDLVLDLRFNSGGSETAARSLASYIGKDVHNNEVFAKRMYNSRVEEVIKADPELGPESLITRFSEKASNVGSMLSGGRVYVLTSSRTASASELVINALKPFMEVFLIGDVTYGKNVGSITLSDDNDVSNRWGLQPIVVKVYNSLDQSDYGNGFIPDVLHKDNGLYIKPLGDPEEALLGQAIVQITGMATTGRQPSPEETRRMIGHSLDMKKRSFNLVIDQALPPGYE